MASARSSGNCFRKYDIESAEDIHDVVNQSDVSVRKNGNTALR